MATLACPKIGLPNSRHLEVLSMSVHKSPLALKQRVGISRTYIRPLQKDLDLTQLSDDEDVVCVNNGIHAASVMHTVRTK